VGYRKEQIIKRFPELTFVYNPDFEITNTSKSLMLALQSTKKRIFYG
jgi:choline kinase